MVKADYGNVILVNFDPSSGLEIQKRRPAVVISNAEFNRTSRLRIVCPITHTDRLYSVAIPEGSPVDGFVLVQQLKSIDCEARQCEVLGSLPAETMAEISNLARLIL